MTENYFFPESREEIWTLLQEKAHLTIPEWKPCQEEMDIGTALAILFTDMISDSAHLFHQKLRQYPLYFYNLLDVQRLPPGDASGYVSFSTVNDEVKGSYLEQGTEVIGDGAEGEPVSFITEDTLFVSPAVLQKIFYVDGENDRISQPLSLPLWENQIENRQSHDLYIGHEYLCSVLTRGEVVLHFPSLSVQQAQELKKKLLHDITWSYSCAEGFHPFDAVRFEEGSLILKKDMGSPEQPSPKMVRRQQNGKNLFWIHAECRPLAPKTQLVLPAFSLSSSGSRLVPDMIYNGERELKADHFLPFGEYPCLYGELYIGSEEVFSKKSSEITVDFELSCRSIPGELVSPEVPIQWKTIMHSSDFEEKKKKEVTIVTVLWEYYNGNGWAVIPGTESYETLFDGGQTEKRIRLVFRCPEDICAVLAGAWETFCIRARIVKMSHTYTIDSVYLVPVIDGLTLSYCYGENGSVPESAFDVNEMLTEPIDCTRECTPFYNSFPKGNMLYLAFSRPLCEEMIRLLIVLRHPHGRYDHRYRCEYYGTHGFALWRAEDETEALSRTGVLVAEACHEFKKHTFFDVSAYWLRLITENGDVSIFQEIQDIIINSVRASAETGSGSRGNLDARQINRTAENIGFINQVTNYDAFTGGYDREDTEQAGRRHAACLRHRDRAVTKKDFEDIVSGNVRNILQVKCFPGRDENGRRAAGHITLVVLTEGGMQQFSEKKKEILECLRHRTNHLLLTEHRLHIVLPQIVTVKGHLSVVIPEDEKQYQVRERLKQRIRDFIHPVTGNFDGKGWEVGVMPTAMQLHNVCSEVEGVSYIRQISLEVEQDKGPYVLGISGNHEIQIYRRNG